MEKSKMYIKKYLYDESASDNKDTLRSHLTTLIHHMMKAVVQGTYTYKNSWEKTVRNERGIIEKLLKIGGTVASYYEDLGNENSDEFGEILEDAWEDACEEMELPVPYGTNPKKVYDNAYKENIDTFMEWTPEDLKDEEFIEDFIKKYMTKPDSEKHNSKRRNSKRQK